MADIVLGAIDTTLLDGDEDFISSEPADDLSKMVLSLRVLLNDKEYDEVVRFGY